MSSTSNPGENLGSFIAESLDCHITLEKDLDQANYKYSHKLRGLSEQPVKVFWWDIRDAEIDDVQLGPIEEVYFDKERISCGPKVKKLLSPVYAGGTRLLLEYERPLHKGETKELQFSFRAPSNALVAKRRTELVGYFYFHAEFAYEAKDVKVEISLPRGAEIFYEYPAGRINSPKVLFPTSDLKPGRIYFYSIFFRRRKPVYAFIWAVGILLVGVLGHAIGTGTAEAILRAILVWLRGIIVVK